ncbi:glycosyltransferase WbsX family protein [Pseudotabrizicola formosa]|uniref:glycosyltransferase WbsX family protein n=1 Tax=Pseudotabrizicola formosa TaxID=2030009 RepID=UPI000CD0B73B|nr:glycoside hydrolase family 99-like domain-containing protein [Pseudotabrizicola formosa]
MRLPIRHCFAYYLPQFHVIPENEAWWGAGFTEWTKVRQAKTFHPQQVILTPGELGWYSLDDPAIMERQYQLARAHSIDTFAFWHYWFDDGNLLLEKPAERLLKSESDVEFCFSWANHDWLKRSTNEVLRQQTYSKDATAHFRYLEPFFHDRRYRKIDGKPVLLLFAPHSHPYLESYINDMHEHAQRSGFPGLCFIFDNVRPKADMLDLCDWHLRSGMPLKFERSVKRFLRKNLAAFGGPKGPHIADYAACVSHMRRETPTDPRDLPVVFPGWDTSIRHGVRGQVLLGNSPELFGQSLAPYQQALSLRDMRDRMMVIKSWNEWAEGNVMEPSAEFGRGHLKAFQHHFEIRADPAQRGLESPVLAQATL